MRATNTATRFGWVTRLLHWIMAVAILGMLVFGWVMVRTPPSLSILWMYVWHKSIGLTLLALALLRLVWHAVSPPPQPIADRDHPTLTHAAKIAHAGLYVLLLAVPLSGWIGSAATGIEVDFYGWTLPALLPASERVEAWGLGLHHLLTWTLAGLVALHVLGALHRHLVARDATLRRMLWGE